MSKRRSIGSMRWPHCVAGFLFLPILVIAQASTAFEETVFIEGIEGGLYNGFEFRIEIDETVESSPDQPETMPRITVTGLIGPHGAEPLVQSLVFDQEFWGEAADMVDVVGLEWLESQMEEGDSAGGSGPGSGPDAGSGSGSEIGASDEELRDAAEDFLAFFDPFLEPHDLMLEELQVAMEEEAFQFAGQKNALGAACDSTWTSFRNRQIGVGLAHMAGLFRYILKSPKTCQSLLPEAVVGHPACLIQLAAWAAAVPLIVAPLVTGSVAKYRLSEVVSGAARDGVGTQVNATTLHADSIARHAKSSEGPAVATSISILGPLPFLGVIAAKSLFDWTVIATVVGEMAGLSFSFEVWVKYWDCQRSVIGPRFEASSVRVRPYLVTQNGWKPYAPVSFPYELTAMRRNTARQNVWEIEAGEIFDQNNGGLPVFNVTTQSQPLVVAICEGVVVRSDPDWLLWPYQGRNTPYVLTPNSYGSQQLPFFGEWWTGIEPRKTVLKMPFGAATTHRVCEDGSGGTIIDNDNDGRPESDVNVACGITHQPGEKVDPGGQVEEDAYLMPAGPEVIGETGWTEEGIDMRCTGIVLDLVSKNGLRGKQVKEEAVLDVASYWTRSSDGKADANPQHPQDSTQIRFRIKDDNWGEPRPHGCYAWDRMTSKWSCKVGASPECPCGGGVGVGGGPGR